VLLGPAEVHAHEHLGEVGRVDTAGPGADRDDGRAVVPLAVEEDLHLEVADRLLQRRELGAGLDRGLLVAGLLGHLDEHLEVVETGVDALHPGELGLPVAQCARHLLGLLGVVPQVGYTRLLGEPGDLGLEGVDVDDGADVAEGGAQRGDLLREV
jgi:hypothetical protein